MTASITKPCGADAAESAARSWPHTAACVSQLASYGPDGLARMRLVVVPLIGKWMATTPG